MRLGETGGLPPVNVASTKNAPAVRVGRGVLRAVLTAPTIHRRMPAPLR